MWFYYLSFVLICLNFVLLVMMKKRYSSSIYVALYVCMVFAAFGYLALGMSKNAEDALLATKMTYFGGQFVPLCMLLIISRFANFKYHKVVAAIGFICAFSFFALTLSAGYNDLYYVSYTHHVADNGVAYLTKEYGPLYFVSKVYLIVFMLVSVLGLIYCFTKLKTVSYKNLFYLVAVLIVTLLFSFISKSFSESIDFMPLGYWLGGIIVLLLLRRTNIYNMDYAASINLDNKEFYGCLGFDLKGNFLGGNQKAYIIFPELQHAKIDLPLPDCDISNKLNNLIEKQKNGSTAPYFHEKIGDKIYKIQMVRNKRSKNKYYGYFAEITDDTPYVEYVNLLNDYSNKLSEEVAAKTEDIRNMQKQIILGMANIVETRDENTGGHVKRTSAVVDIITNSIKRLGIASRNDEFYENVRRAAPMHDLGKITISNDILNKPGKFTPEEFEIMKTHASMGEKMVAVVLEGIENHEFVEITKNVARYHHEKFGGGGYPDGLKGEEIPLEARIMALADVYDALVSKRCYKEKMDYASAARIIRDSFGPHFDPALAPVFEDCREQLENYYRGVEAE